MKIILALFLFYAMPAWAIRVISTSPALSEMVSMLGHEKELVGVTPFCLDGQHASKIGTALELDLERVLSLRPDVILLQENTPSKTHQDLKKLGLNVVALPLVDLVDIERAWQRLMQLFGSKSDFLQVQLKRLEKIKGHGNIAIILGGAPEKNLMLAGAATYYADILKKGGFENAVKSSGWPLLDAEQTQALAAKRVRFLELVSDKKKGWEKGQWQRFCPSCNVHVIHNARVLYPGVKMLEHMVNHLEQLHD